MTCTSVLFPSPKFQVHHHSHPTNNDTIRILVMAQTGNSEPNSLNSPPPPPPPEELPSKSPSPGRSPSPSPSPARGSPPLTAVSRANRGELAVATKVGGLEGGAGGDKRSRVVEGIVRRSRSDVAVRRAGAGLRVAAAVLALISFSVMAADKTKGWAGDSFDRYREYRFCISANVLAFVYSTFQIYAHIHQTIKGKHIITAPFCYYFDLFLDQMLAYLLLSASSAAATRNYDWVSNWGNDPFTVMINGSVSMSFLAFIAFAISSLVSSYNLYSGNT